MVIPPSRATATMAGVCGIVLTTSLSQTVAQVGEGPHARVSLIAERTQLKPDDVTWVGVRFAIDEGWHIYWRNPGESGSAPRIRWAAPATLTLGEVQWPAPTRIATSGLVNYGYEKSVLLLAPVRPQRTQPSNAPVVIAASVRYVICRDVCLSAAAEVSLTTTIGFGARGAAADLFERARAALPEAPPAAWTLTACCDSDGFVLSVDGVSWSARRGFLFIPSEAGLIDDGAIQRVIQRDRHHAAQTAVILDSTGSLGRLFGAKVALHMVVIDTAGTVIYTGAIDDRPTPDASDLEGATNYVAAALREAMAKHPVSTPTTRPYGCTIAYAPASSRMER